MRVRFDFVGNWVVYTTVIAGAAYQSLHNRSGMSEQEAKRAFHREHAREIQILMAQNIQHAN